MADFIAQLGNIQNQGLLPLDKRLNTLPVGQNPYITGASLPANSPLFFGRQRELHDILSVLRQPNKPSSVSLLGERRIGKSSLLNQIFQELNKEDKLCAVFATAQNFSELTEQTFFKSLKQNISQVVNPDLIENEIVSYDNLRDYIQSLAKQGYRFVIMIDEFEKLSGNPEFKTSFFSHLRALGERPEFRLGYVISSRRALQHLCQTHKIEESNFWNIFDQKILGLLNEKDAKDLLFKPLQKTLAIQFPDDNFWDKFKTKTGCHPLLIQLTASEYWNAKHSNSEFNTIGVKMNLHRFMKDWFYQRSLESQQQWLLLVQAAGDKKIEETAVFYDLQLRGLLLKNGKTFCPYFAKVIVEECEKKSKKSFEEYINEITQGLEKGFEIVGKFWGIFKKSSKLSNEIKNDDD
jgi:hypothetical protein